MLRALALMTLGLMGLLLLCELLLQALPVSTATLTGYHQDPLIISYPPHHDWTAATGWDLRNARLNRTNNAGFVAHRDFVPDAQAVALIGDSFVEASMLAPADRPGVQLERALAGRPVYTLGMPGSALLDYAERMRWVQQRYGVRDFVLLLEVGDLKQSLCGSGNVHGPCLDRVTLTPRTEIKPAAGGLKPWLRHSALAQYLFSQLKLDPQRLWQQAVKQARAPAEAPRARLDGASPNSAAPIAPQHLVVARTFFERIAGLQVHRLVIVLDTHRDAIYAGRPGGNAEQQAFSAMARETGAVVVDAAPLLARDYAQRGLSFDVGPYDKHLNPLGVRLLMQAAGSALRDMPGR